MELQHRSPIPRLHHIEIRMKTGPLLIILTDFLNKLIDRRPDEQTEKRDEVLTEIAKIKEVLQ